MYIQFSFKNLTADRFVKGRGKLFITLLVLLLQFFHDATNGVNHMLLIFLSVKTYWMRSCFCLTNTRIC